MAPEAQRSISPEVRAERRALQVRLETEHEPDLVLIKTSNGFFRYLPPLDGSSRPESWVPRFRPETGELYISRWHDPTKTSVSPDGKKVRYVPLPKGRSYVQLVKPAWVRGEVDLTRIPLHWEVEEIIPQKHWDIESALRQQDEVSHDYGTSGPEFTRVSDIAIQIRGLSGKFIGRKVTADNLSQLRSEVDEVLVANGLRRPNDATLEAIADKLTRAAARDSLGRINPGRSRQILASAYVNAAMREVGLRRSGEKAVRVYSLLLAEREIERTNLEAAKALIDGLVGADLNKPRDRIFDYEVPQNIPDEEVTRFRKEELSQIVTVLRSLRVNPYFLVARMSDLTLTGNDFRLTTDVKAMTSLLKDAGMEWLLNFSKNDSVDRIIRQKDTAYAKSMMKIVSSLIGWWLKDKEHQAVKVF